MRFTPLLAFMAANLITPLASSDLMITNECATPVYLNLVCGTASQPERIPVYATARIPYPVSTGGETACSAKLNLDNNARDVFQFEYSFDADYKLWWDLSSLDGDPFLDSGRVVYTSGGDSGTAHCPTRLVCLPGSERCAYYEFNEEGPDWYCSAQTNITLTLCETENLSTANDSDWVVMR